MLTLPNRTRRNELRDTQLNETNKREKEREKIREKNSSRTKKELTAIVSGFGCFFLLRFAIVIKKKRRNNSCERKIRIRSIEKESKRTSAYSRTHNSTEPNRPICTDAKFT